MALDDRYVTATGLDDTLGTGLRLHTDHDEVYELREVGGTDVRVYGTDDDWRVKVRFPETDLDPAYDRFDAVAERLEEAYDTDLITPATIFLDDANSGSVETRSGPITLRYNEEGEDGLLTVDDMRSDIPAGPDMLVGIGYVCSGVAGGAAAGASAAGPEGMLVGGVGGIVAGFAGFFKELEGFPHSPIGYSIKGMKNTRKRVQRLRERRKTRSDRLEKRDMWDMLNEKHRLDAVADETRDLDEARRHEELREADIEETVDALMEHNFYRFDRQKGVTATMTADSYGEALDFAATVLERDTVEHERPSIYDDRDVFRGVFEAAQEGRQEELIRTVYSDGASEPVETYLDEHHQVLVERTGQNRTLEGDTR